MAQWATRLRCSWQCANQHAGIGVLSPAATAATRRIHDSFASGSHAAHCQNVRFREHADCSHFAKDSYIA